MQEYEKRYQQWLESDIVDEATKEELRQIANDPKEIEERFYRDLEFGTGGLRGVMAAGTNRMNIYTVRRATQGLANYLLAKDPKTPEMGVAIAYDSRNNSPLFAEETAAVMNGNGIKTYVFESLRPTPELSFAVRTLGCKSGIVITASHNPSKYNGYKAYWDDGCQVLSPMDHEIIDEVEKVSMFDGVKVMPRAEAEAKGLYNVIGEEIDKQYIDAVSKVIIDPETLKKTAPNLRIVYTPLHGAGNIPVRRALAACGFTDVTVVPEQELPDGNFPTAAYPNPEDIKVFSLAIELGKKIDADILIATDPDADRMGIVVKNGDEYIPFTGNMVGVLFAAYILEARKKTGNLPADGFIVKTIVSTEMIRALTDEYGIELREVLTGFKYIGEQMTKSETEGGHYFFGFEESYGYLTGMHARDKDSVNAVLLVSELAAYYKSVGMNLVDAMHALYEKYGYYKEEQVSLAFEGIEGVQKIQNIMNTLRGEAKECYGGKKVLRVIDYKNGADGLPASNVLRFILEDNCWVCVRPSGTEPKIKFYFGVKGQSEAQAKELIEALKKDVVDAFR